MVRTPARSAIAAFEACFGQSPAVVARAPGRVNLIGEHTDYTGGYVLPMAIDREIALAGRPRADRLVRACAMDFEDMVEFALDTARLDAVQRDPAHPWSDYLRGVYAALQAAGWPVVGADVAIAGDVPRGAGLSSSAALEVATVMFAQATGGFELPAVEAVRLARTAENEFVGVACGVMDQFVARLARQGTALLIDTESLEYRHIPLPPGAAFVVTDTGVRRQLVSSEYNRRRAECEAALAAARRHLRGAWRLPRQLSRGDLAALEGAMPAVQLRRLRHLVEENARVLEAVQALRQGRLAAFGELMNASHESLRTLFEVSSPELDAAVSVARRVPGVLGARMTGAGFGGCTVTLVDAQAVPRLVVALKREYPPRTGKVPQVLVVQASDGASAATAPGTGIVRSLPG